MLLLLTTEYNLPSTLRGKCYCSDDSRMSVYSSIITVGKAICKNCHHALPSNILHV